MGYRRILLKLSGEAFRGEQGPFAPDGILEIAKKVAAIANMGVEVGVVTGGGNILRGGSFCEEGPGRITADTMGMLATVINSMALQDALDKLGQETRVLSAVEMSKVCEPFVLRRAIGHLEKKRVIILAGGTGNPYFTTDTAAALRAAEIGAEVLVKATKVDGVYTADPVKDPTAVKIDEITYEEVLGRNLGVMDLTAITLCRERRLPVVVLKMSAKDDLIRLISGERVGTLVTCQQTEGA